MTIKKLVGLLCPPHWTFLVKIRKSNFIGLRWIFGFFYALILDLWCPLTKLIGILWGELTCLFFWNSVIYSNCYTNSYKTFCYVCWWSHFVILLLFHNNYYVQQSWHLGSIIHYSLDSITNCNKLKLIQRITYN